MIIKVHQIALVSILIINIFIACKKKEINNNETQEKSGEIGIVLIDKTIMRVDPVLYSSVITNLKKGDQLKILDKSREKTWISNSDYYWYRVSFSSGYTGWVYGMNIKIFPENERDDIKKFLSRFWDAELTKIKSQLSGRWTSVKLESTYPEQFIELNNNGEYKSYLKDSVESDIIEGKYSLNYKDSEIVFQNGTYFGARINFVFKDNGLYLTRETKDKEIEFKKNSDL